MSAIHYKFSSSNDYKNVTFDGMSISVQDCKTAIMQKEKLKMTEVDLLITNAQSLKDYREETALIPKNTALLVRRIPIGASPASDTSKVYIVKRNESAASKKSESSYMTLDQLRKTDDLAAANATEQDKIKAMMDQSTTEYDPSKYLRPPRPGSYQRYDSNVHLPHVKCFKCNQTGHYSSQCRLSRPLTERAKSIRPATGIPRSHMVQVNKDARGAMLTPDGHYVVPFIDKKGYEIGKKEKPPFLPEVKETKEDDEDEPVPDELICLLCKEIMEDAVVIPCCGNSYCDECIRNALLESEDHECPTCHKKNISPDSLIANKFLRQAVIKFLNETGISRKKSNAPVWPRPAPTEPKPTRQPQPTKVTYGPPKPKSQAAQPPTTSGPYVVKARSAQIYAAQGYTIKKATSTTLTNVVSTVVTPTVALPTPTTQEIVKQEPVKQEASTTPADSVLDSSASTLSSEERPGKIDVETEPLPPGISPDAGLSKRAVRSLDMDNESSLSESSDGPEDASNKARKRRNLRHYSVKGIQPAANVKTEPKISPLNMMVERPTTESPPPPPPPPLVPPLKAEQPEIAENLPTAEFPVEAIPVEPEEEPPVEEPPIEQPSQPPPPVLDDMPPEVVTHFSVQPNGINITLKNPPPVPEKPEPVLIVDPPLNVQMPAQRAAAALLAASVASRPPMMMPMTGPPPRIGHLPHGIRMNIPPPTGAMIRNRPPHMIPTSIRPPTIPTSIPPPGLMRPLVQRIGIPPPMNLLPPGVMPHHMPFPPPPGIPPPGFLQHPVSSASSLVSIEGHSAPPRPPGTGTPPTLATPPVKRERKRGERRSSSRTKHENKENKPASKSRQSKLALMSDEFTRKLKEKPAPRGRRPKRGRSANRSGSESYSSSSYSSSSSRSSFSSSGTSSYSTSGSSRSRSRSPVRRRKKREAGRRPRKTESYSESRSPSPTRRKRGKNVSSKYRKDSRSPKRPNRSRRRRVDASPRRETRHHERRRRSRSRDRRRSASAAAEESAIPGMPPQSVLDYERDLALYDYYKQKYEQDWLRNHIYPPSPFKRFITYNPTKIQPPNVQSQPVLREVAPHPGPIPMQGHPSMYSQPPPPGDATPTEEDAGMYAFRDRTPERFIMRQGPPPWDQPMFDGDPAQRARVLQEEEYHARMHNKLQGEQGWEQRGGSYPDPRFDPRGRPDPRERGRFIDERDRRRSGRTPPMERGRRSWEHGGDRWPSRERRREEDIRRGHFRDSREGDWDGRRNQKDTHASRREDETRGPRKRGQEAESSRGDPERRKRSRVTKRTENPENLPSEPFPPGEGDATPVRDETRVEITNESIKVKVINDRVKQQTDRKKEREKPTKVRETSSRRGDKVHPPAEKRLSDSKSRRALKPVGKKAAPVKVKEEPKVVPTTHEDSRPDFVPPAAERSPTPTLDENVSPIQFDDVPDALDVHARASVSEIEQHVPLIIPEAAPKKTESRVTKRNEDRLGKQHERRRVKKPPPKRVVTKQQRKVPTSSVRNEARDIKAKSAESIAKELIEAIVPKSRWESDDESPVRILSKEIEPETSPKTQNFPEVKLVKQRKIRIKKPSLKVAKDPPIKTEKQIELEPTKQTPEMNTKDATEKQERNTNPQGAADSRRVVVSNDAQMIEKPASKPVRALRPTISQIDETTFEPDYNDNESENALSNYAPSDFEEEEKRAKNGIRKQESSDRKYHPGKRPEEDGEEEDSGEERSDEAHEKSKKKKKKKKKKRRKHHRQYDDDDFEDEDTFQSDSEEAKYEHHSSKSRKEEKRKDAKSTKHNDDEQTELRVHSRSKKDRRYSEKGRRDFRRNVGSSGRKRKSERDRTDGYSDGESGEIEEKRSRRRSHRSPKEKRRRMSGKDELSLEDNDYSLEDEPYPEEKRKHKKKQKHKKSKREPKESSTKEVKTVASRIRNTK